MQCECPLSSTVVHPFDWLQQQPTSKNIQLTTTQTPTQSLEDGFVVHLSTEHRGTKRRSCYPINSFTDCSSTTHSSTAVDPFTTEEDTIMNIHSGAPDWMNSHPQTRFVNPFSDDQPPLKVARFSELTRGASNDSITEESNASLPDLSPRKQQEEKHLREVDSPSSTAATLSNPSSSPSSPTFSSSRPTVDSLNGVDSLFDTISPACSSSVSLQQTPASLSLQLPTSISSSSSTSPLDAPTTTLSGMRGRWLKTLSMPFQLSVPDENLTAIDSKLGSLIIPIALASVEPKRSPLSLAASQQRTPRSQTPPPYGSPCHSASLLQPFPFARNFEGCMDGIQSSGSMFGVSAHQGTRSNMQDSFTCQPQSKLFIVADGHGRAGHIVAALTTSMLPSLFQTALTVKASPTDAFTEAFAAMDSHLLKHTTGGGSTALACHIATTDAATNQRSLILAHVGDSRAVLSSSSGQARALTRDHKPEVPEEKAAILARGGTVTQNRKQIRDARSLPSPHHRLIAAPSTPQQHSSHFTPFSAAFTGLGTTTPRAILECSLGSTSVTGGSTPSGIIAPSSWRVEGLLNLSRSLGDGHLKQYISAVPTVSEHVIVESDEFVILATDGVWNVFTDQEAVTCVTNFIKQQQQSNTATGEQTKHIHSLPARAADHLTTQALQRGSLDNVLAIVLLLQKP